MEKLKATLFLKVYMSCYSVRFYIMHTVLVYYKDNDFSPENQGFSHDFERIIKRLFQVKTDN